MRLVSSRLVTGLVTALAAGVLALGGCGGDDSSKGDSALAHDLASMTNDLSVQQSCAQIYACTTGANTPLQIGTCTAGGTASAQQLYMSLYQCALAQCMLDDGGVSVDGGAGSCTSVSDDTAACNTCVQAAEASAACSSQLSACENS